MATQTKKHSIKVILKFELMFNAVIPTTKKETELYISGYLSGYFSLFSKISELLKTSFMTEPEHSNYIKYTFRLFAYQPKSKYKVIEYFNNFPLLGRISRDYEL